MSAAVDADATPGQRIVAWYRPAVAARLIRVTLSSAVLTCAGMVLVGLAVHSGRVVEGARFAVGVAGGLLVLAGPLSMVLRFHRVLITHDGHLALRPDGVDIALPGLLAFVAWDALVGARVESKALVLERRAAPPLVISQRFIGVGTDALAREIETTRKRVGLGLLR